MIFIKAQDNKKYRVDTVFYQIGKVIWLPFCMVGVWFSHGGYERFGEQMECSVRKLCGLPCPGCGITRAFYYLFQGNFVKSFWLNPIVIFGLLVYLHFMMLYFYRSHVSGTIKEKEIRILVYVYAVIFVLLAQWAVKMVNILCLCL